MEIMCNKIHTLFLHFLISINHKTMQWSAKFKMQLKRM